MHGPLEEEGPRMRLPQTLGLLRNGPANLSPVQNTTHAEADTHHVTGIDRHDCFTREAVLEDW